MTNKELEKVIGKIDNGDIMSVILDIMHIRKEYYYE